MISVDVRGVRLIVCSAIALFTALGAAAAYLSSALGANLALSLLRLAVVGSAATFVVLRARPTPWNARRILVLAFVAVLGLFVLIQPLPIAYRVSRAALFLVVMVVCAWSSEPLRALRSSGRARLAAAALVALELAVSVSTLSADMEAYGTAQGAMLRAMAAGEPITGMRGPLLSRADMAERDRSGRYIPTAIARGFASAADADPYRFFAIELLTTTASAPQCAIGVLGRPNFGAIVDDNTRTMLYAGALHCARALGRRQEARAVYERAASERTMPFLTAECERTLQAQLLDAYLDDDEETRGYVIEQQGLHIPKGVSAQRAYSVAIAECIMRHPFRRAPRKA